MFKILQHVCSQGPRKVYGCYLGNVFPGNVRKPPEIRAWSVTADARWPALAGYSSANAVQTCCDSPSLSSALSSDVPRRLLCASLWSSWLPTSASARCHQLSIPRVRRSTLGTRAFSVTGPTMWNSLPDHLRDPSVDSEQFRRDLKTYLFVGHFVALAH